MGRLHQLIRSVTIALAALILIVGASMAANRVLAPPNSAPLAEGTENDVNDGAVKDINDGAVSQLDNGGGPENQLDNGGGPDNQLDNGGVTDMQVSGGTSGGTLPDAAMSR
jgi:hypothetical protein